MRLYLIRHSVPEQNDPDDDEDPELSDEGKEIAAALGQWMIDKEEIPTVLIASPRMRTQETAAIVADTIEGGGFARPDIQTDSSIGPHMSIKGAVEKIAADKAMVRVGIVSHHESLEHGLRVLDREPYVHLDIFAQGELRIVKVRRKTGEWKEHRRVQPSDLGLDDHY